MSAGLTPRATCVQLTRRPGRSLCGHEDPTLRGIAERTTWHRDARVARLRSIDLLRTVSRPATLWILRSATPTFNAVPHLLRLRHGVELLAGCNRRLPPIGE